MGVWMLAIVAAVLDVVLDRWLLREIVLVIGNLKDDWQSLFENKTLIRITWPRC